MLSLRKAAHGALAKVSEDVPRLRFNRCVAHIYELSNALQASLAAAKQAGAVSPALAGMLYAAAPFAWPLVIGGTLKIAYDLALLAMFSKVKPET